MYVRLGFAVAAHVEPDILLVDEVLAVGDASFRTRCLQRIRDLQRGGTTVVLVSHNMHQIREVCDSALLLAQGQIRSEGEPSAVIREYEKLILVGDSRAVQRGQHDRPSFESEGNVIISAVDVTQKPQAADGLDGYRPAIVRIHYRTSAPQQIARIYVVVYRDDGTVCSTVDSSRTSDAAHNLTEVNGQGVIELTYEPLQLVSGRYYIRVQITDSSDSIVLASGHSPMFHVYSEDGGIYLPRVSWESHSA
jgi:ABC-type multidrug transport system ATPase subunit